MYTITKEQLASLKTFIGKLDETMIKGRIEKWVGDIKNNRVTVEEMEKFVGFATHLPLEFQSFPQTWFQTVKNTPETERREEKEEVENTADLNKTVKDSLKAIPNEQHEKPSKEEVKEDKAKQKVEDDRILASNKQVENKEEKVVPPAKADNTAKATKK